MFYLSSRAMDWGINSRGLALFRSKSQTKTANGEAAAPRYLFQLLDSPINGP
jgi:hypothetical protein